MPNFAHGTAGIAFFLASYFLASGNTKALAAAKEGGNHLRHVARTYEGGCVVHHYEPGGEKEYLGGWCHGPAGTGRLFLVLSQADGSPDWDRWAERAGVSALSRMKAAAETPNAWSQCCGLAGMMEYVWDLGERPTLNSPELPRGISHLEELGARIVRGEEPGVPPGLMKGVSGIGSALLRLPSRRKAGNQSAVRPSSALPWSSLTQPA
jgi:hypothetical protein